MAHTLIKLKKGREPIDDVNPCKFCYKCYLNNLSDFFFRTKKLKMHHEKKI